MKLGILLFVLVILLAFQFVIFKGLADSAKQENIGESKPLTHFLIRYWWLGPIVLLVVSIVL